jgi:hypothetical protein
MKPGMDQTVALTYADGLRSATAILHERLQHIERHLQRFGPDAIERVRSGLRDLATIERRAEVLRKKIGAKAA